MSKQSKADSELTTYTPFRRFQGDFKVNPLAESSPMQPGIYTFSVEIIVQQEDIGKTFLEILNDVGS